MKHCLKCFYHTLKRPNSYIGDKCRVSVRFGVVGVHCHSLVFCHSLLLSASTGFVPFAAEDKQAAYRLMAPVEEQGSSPEVLE